MLLEIKTKGNRTAESTQKLLLALYVDAKDNIMFLKTRASFVLATYTVIMVFLAGGIGDQSETPNRILKFIDDHSDLLFLIFFVSGFFVTLRLYVEICTNIDKHRDRIKRVVEQFKKDPTFEECFGGIGVGAYDSIWNSGGVAYIITVFFLVFFALDLGSVYKSDSGHLAFFATFLASGHFVCQLRK